jgi:hypothetical protein
MVTSAVRRARGRGRKWVACAWCAAAGSWRQVRTPCTCAHPARTPAGSWLYLSRCASRGCHPRAAPAHLCAASSRPEEDVRTPGRPGRAAAPETGARHSAIAAPLSVGRIVNYIVCVLQRDNEARTECTGYANESYGRGEAGTRRPGNAIPPPPSSLNEPPSTGGINAALIWPCTGHLCAAAARGLWAVPVATRRRSRVAATVGKRVSAGPPTVTVPAAKPEPLPLGHRRIRRSIFQNLYTYPSKSPTLGGSNPCNDGRARGVTGG